MKLKYEQIKNIMTLEQAKKIVNKDGGVHSDEEVLEYIKSATILSDIFIDMWVKMTPEERTKYKNKAMTIIN